MKLTRHELILLIGAMAALLTGVLVKHYRDKHPPAKPLPASIRGR